MLGGKFEKFLIIQTASIGDVVLATPVIEKLGQYFPGAAIDFLLKKGNESLLKDHPLIRKVIVRDKSSSRLNNLLSLLHSIRKEKYDVVINLQRFAVTGLLTIFSGAQITLGFRKNPLSLFFTRALPHRISSDPDLSDHEVNRNLSLIDSITDLSRNFRTRLYPSRADFQKVEHLKNTPYITIAPASLWFTKQFPASQWIELLQQIGKEWRIYLLGAREDEPLCDRIISGSNHPGAINLAGKLSFLETAALMRDATMNYVNDSAPLHFCSAMNAPVTAIFCSTVPAFGFGPLSDKSWIVQTNESLDCRPCGLHGRKFCPEKHFRCATSIQTETLLAPLNEFIRQRAR